MRINLFRVAGSALLCAWLAAENPVPPSKSPWFDGEWVQKAPANVEPPEGYLIAYKSSHPVPSNWRLADSVDFGPGTRRHPQTGYSALWEQIKQDVNGTCSPTKGEAAILKVEFVKARIPSGLTKLLHPFAPFPQGYIKMIIKLENSDGELLAAAQKTIYSDELSKTAGDAIRAFAAWTRN